MIYRGFGRVCPRRQVGWLTDPPHNHDVLTSCANTHQILTNPSPRLSPARDLESFSRIDDKANCLLLDTEAIEVMHYLLPCSRQTRFVDLISELLFPHHGSGKCREHRPGENVGLLSINNNTQVCVAEEPAFASASEALFLPQ